MAVHSQLPRFLVNDDFYLFLYMLRFNKLCCFCNERFLVCVMLSGLLACIKCIKNWNIFIGLLGPYKVIN